MGMLSHALQKTMGKIIRKQPKVKALDLVKLTHKGKLRLMSRTLNLQESIKACVAVRSDPVLFTPRMPEVIEQIPLPQEMEDVLGVNIISNQSQSTQQGKDVIESQN